MTRSGFPLVSVIIPTFNEEENIVLCLKSIKKQSYPKDKIEIIVVDDGSTDNTVKIAKKFGAKVFYSGFHHIERSKSIGLAKARGELVVLLDADIELISSDWLKKSVKAFLENRGLIGAQSVYWQYKRSHNPFNRYCELFGVNDPFVYCLGKRGVLAPFEKNWIYPESIIKDFKDYTLVRFTKDNLPTLGSQGFLAKKSLLLKTSWKPYFFHLDSVHELVEKGHDKFAMMKLEVFHHYTKSFWDHLKKLYRNVTLFLKYQNYRQYNYGVGGGKFTMTTVLMVTLALPFYQATGVFLKSKDPAAFLHPVYCFVVPIIYTFVFLKWIILKR